MTDVLGSVTDENLDFYTLDISPAGQNQWRTVFKRNFTAAPGVDGVVSGVLGTLDPTLLSNDLYELRITAQDVSGNISSRTIEWAIEASAKLGKLPVHRFAELLRLRCTVCGPGVAAGWHPNSYHPQLRYAERSVSRRLWLWLDHGDCQSRINESVRISASEAAGGGSLVANPFRVGTRVYLNAPDGRRVGFTFDPVPTAGLLGAVWSPRFIADPGVEMDLQVEPVSLSQQADGTFAVYLFGLPYNPDAYTLITRDQVRYTTISLLISNCRASPIAMMCV